MAKTCENKANSASEEWAVSNYTMQLAVIIDFHSARSAIRIWLVATAPLGSF